jgi:hypothetical protein
MQSQHRRHKSISAALRAGNSCLVERLEGRRLLTATAAANFSWSMPNRYGVDTNNNGIIDLPNSYAYVHPAGYTVNFDAAGSTASTSITGYSWTLTGGVLNTPMTFTGENPSVPTLAQGSYDVTLDVTASGGATATTSQMIDVRDYLIVALGDSYGSGEGNPEVPSTDPQDVQWADGVTPAMTTENFEAHRSSASYSSQAALTLEESDPHSSVTYVDLSISGATIANGMLGNISGTVDPSVTLEAEIPELKSIVGTREIDALTLSIGGNDYGFSTYLDQLLEQNESGLPSYTTIESERNTALAALPGDFSQLETALKSFSIANTYITAYPDLTQVAPGDYEPFATDVLPGDGLKGISAASAQFASQQLVDPLNQAIQQAAQANGWTFVNGYANDFLSHGYAAATPWFQTETVAASMQGDDISVLGGLAHVSSGAFHPNKAGLADEASYVLAAIKSNLTNPLFDENYYLSVYPDVAQAVAAGTIASGYDHYLQYGQYEGRNPSPYWAESWYLQENPDVAAAVKTGAVSSGFMHYYLYGQYENRPGLLYFNEDYYLSHNADVAAAVGDGQVTSGFEHFMLYGQYEDRSPMMYFNSAIYDADNADILPYVHGEVFSSDYEHFIEYGQFEGREASAFYNEQIYLADNADVAAAVSAHVFPDGFIQWLEYGQYEGRTAV